MQQQQQVDFKIMFIGNSSVGKTSLLLRFSNSRWHETSPTVPIDFTAHKMQVRGKNVLLRIWDTGGQERFRTLTSSYYRDAHGVILVYDVSSRETFEMLEGWYADIEKNTTMPVVKMLVGNKVDKAPREVSTSEGEAYARRTDSLFVEASAKTGVGVTEMLRVLVEKMLKTQELKDVRRLAVRPTLEQNGSREKKGTSCC